MRTSLRRTATVAAVGICTALAATAAIAQTSDVTQSVTAGTLDASIGDLNLDAAAYSHSNQDSAGALALNVNDTSGTGDGWNVTVQTGDFAHSGSEAVIGADNFALTTANAPVVVDGQEGGLTPLADGGSLDQARAVLVAAEGSGMGEYEQALDVTLNVPGQSLAGTYTGVVTTTVTSGPSS